MSLPTAPPFQPQFNYLSNKLYQMEAYPVQLNCQFTVAPSNGLGITGLIGAGIANVFMHTSTTPAAGNYGITNPNPDAGVILVQLQNNFSKLFNVRASLQAPVTGSQIGVTASGALLTPGTVYVIDALGTTTAANWLTLGLPAGLTAAVGQAFVAKATGAGTGSGKVKAVGVTATTSVELMAAPMLQMANVYQNGGGQILLQCLAPTIDTGAYKAPMIPTAPATGTLVSLSLYLSNSSVTTAGL